MLARILLRRCEAGQSGLEPENRHCMPGQKALGSQRKSWEAGGRLNKPPAFVGEKEGTLSEVSVGTRTSDLQ